MKIRKKNLIGDRFGRLLVVGHYEGKYWSCVCDCGTEKKVREDSLENGTTRSCGCLMRELAKERETDNYKDKTGKRFGRLTVVKWVGSGNWLCKCDCGNEKIVLTSSLMSGGTKSCGCLCDEARRKSKDRKPKENLIGKKFGRLLVKKYNKKGSWVCLCDCGNKHIVKTFNLKSGNTKSCGCLYVDSRGQVKNIKHGLTKTPFYNFWRRLKARCNNPKNKSYKDYGGRGITYDTRWEEFENFYKDMYFKYLYAIKQLKIKKPSIERKDFNGNYCRENCCFIEHSDQSKNTRHVIVFEAISPEGIKTEELNVNEFAKKYGLNTGHICNCIGGLEKTHKGWKFKKINNV